MAELWRPLALRCAGQFVRGTGGQVIVAGKEDIFRQLSKGLDAQFAQLAERTRRVRANKSKARPVSVDENPTVLGNWGSVAESVAVLAAQGAGIPGADAAAKVIQALIGIEDAQSVMLKRIRRDVELLRMGPFRAAQEQLAIAHRKGRTNAEYGRHLQEAEDLLVQAVAQAATIEEASVIRFNLGVVAAARGDEEEARYRLNESYSNCVEVTQELISRSGDVKVLKSRSTAAMLAIYWPAYSVVGIRKFLKVQKAQEATIALEGYVPFVNTVARAGNAMERRATRPGIRLRRSSVEGYELEWTDPHY
jgi:hypothetical protein